MTIAFAIVCFVAAVRFVGMGRYVVEKGYSPFWMFFEWAFAALMVATGIFILVA